MALAYGAVGTPVYSTSNPAPSYPAGGTASRKYGYLLFVATKPDNTPATTPAGWTLLGAFAGGAGSTGIDTGPMRIGVFYRESTSVLTGSVTVTVTGNNVSAAWIERWECLTTEAFDWGITGGADTTTGATFSVVTSAIASGFIKTGDGLSIPAIIPTDTNPTYGTYTLTAAGGGTIALGTITQTALLSTTSGQDMGGRAVTCLPTVTGTVGAGTLTLSIALTGTTTNAAGPAAIVRVRALAPPTAPTSAPTVAAGVDKVTVTTPATLEGGATSYKVYRGGTLVASGVAANTATDDTGASVTSTQTYTVRGTNAAGDSTDSPASSAVAANPSPPTGLNTTPANNQITVAWTARPYTATYKVYRGPTGGSRTLVHTSAANATSWVDTGAVNGTTYDYTVSSNVSTPTVRESAQSAIDTETGGAPPAYPTMVQIAPEGTSDIDSLTVQGVFNDFCALGNLIWVAVAVDKSSGAFFPPSGFTTFFEDSSSSVSTWIGYKESDGTEMTIDVSWTNVSPAGATIHMSEWASTGSGSWTILGSASDDTDETLVTAWGTGTTSATTGPGAGIAFFAIDSGSSGAFGSSYTNGYTELHPFHDSGRGAIAVATKAQVGTGTLATTTQTHSPTTDQKSGAIAVFGRFQGASTPTLPIPRLTGSSTVRALTRTPGTATRAVVRLTGASALRVVGRVAGSTSRAIARQTGISTLRVVGRVPGKPTRAVARLTGTSVVRALARVPGTASRSIPRLTGTSLVRALTRTPGAVARAIPRLTGASFLRAVAAVRQPFPLAIPRLTGSSVVRALGRVPGKPTRTIVRLTGSSVVRALGRTPGATTRAIVRLTGTSVIRALGRTPGKPTRAIPRLVGTSVLRAMVAQSPAVQRAIVRLTGTGTVRAVGRVPGKATRATPRLTGGGVIRVLGRTPGKATKAVTRLVGASTVRVLTRTPGKATRAVPRLVGASVLRAVVPRVAAILAIPRLVGTSTVRAIQRTPGTATRVLSRVTGTSTVRTLGRTPGTAPRAIPRLVGTSVLRALAFTPGGTVRSIVRLVGAGIIRAIQALDLSNRRDIDVTVTGPFSGWDITGPTSATTAANGPVSLTVSVSGPTGGSLVVQGPAPSATTATGPRS
jgi:hypothetical protein